MGAPFSFRYGGYSHPAGEVTPKLLAKELIQDSGGNPVSVKHHWELEGRLHADSEAALTGAIDALQRAYLIQNQSCGFYDSDGTPTAHVLYASDGEIRVVEPVTFLEGPGEYTTYRTFRVVIEAVQSVPPTSEEMWSQRFTFSGGGPVYRWVPARNAPPQLQLVTMQATYSAVQDGSQDSAVEQPGCAPPRWPEDGVWMRERTQITFEPPKPIGDRSRFRTTWHYEFENDQPFI